MPPVDPNEVLMTGENSFIRLSPDGGKTQTDRTSHWRVLWCPAGAGHALFIQSTLTDGKVRIYSDNIAVARWLQKTIETLLFPAFADTSLPVLAAAFERHGGPWSTSTTGRSACSAPSSRPARPSSRSTARWHRAMCGRRCAATGRAAAPPSRGPRPG